jgi:hypothetical protein
VLPFENNVVRVKLNPRDSVMTNAQKLASLPCGGTNCSAVLIDLNARKVQADLVIYVSDNESWMDTPYHGHFGGSATRTMSEWQKFKQRNPKARLVCLDIQPYATTQAQEREDILNIGGFLGCRVQRDRRLCPWRTQQRPLGRRNRENPTLITQTLEPGECRSGLHLHGYVSPILVTRLHPNSFQMMANAPRNYIEPVGRRFEPCLSCTSMAVAQSVEQLAHVSHLLVAVTFFQS